MAFTWARTPESVDTSGTDPALTVTSSASGSLLIFEVAWNSNTVALNSVDDNVGNTWVLVRSQVHASVTISSAVYRCIGATAGVTTITAHFASSLTNVQLISMEAVPDGGETVSLDQVSGADEASGTTKQHGTITTTGTDEVIVGICRYNNSPGVVTGSAEADLSGTVGTRATWHRAIKTTTVTQDTDFSHVTARSGALCHVSFKSVAAGPAQDPYNPWPQMAPILAQ